MILYDKIIRDEIPSIIEGKGKKYEVEEVDDEKALEYLKAKLDEELQEFYKSNSLEELADLLEVIDGIAMKMGENFQKILKLKEDKKKERGGFEKNLILKKVW